MAAGDILLTIKAKYDSVDAAYVAVKGIQDAITGINKTKIDIKGLQGATTNSKNLAKELGIVEKRFSLFTGRNPWGIRTLSNNLRTLNEQLAGAALQLGNNAKAANRKNAALTLVAGAYKKARIQLIGYSQVQKELWRRSEIERKKFKGKEPAAFAFQDYSVQKPTVRKPGDYGVAEPIRIESRKYDEVKPYQEFLASLKAEGGEFDKRIKSGRDGLRGDAELRKQWNTTERNEWKAQEQSFQQEQKKIYSEWAAAQKKFLAEQKANITADEKNLQAWTSAKQKHEAAEVAREKEVLAAKKKYDNEKRLFETREDERIAKKSGKSNLADTKYLGNVEAMAGRMQAIAGKPASLGQVELALQQIAPLIDWAVEDTEEWNLLTKTQNQLMEKRVALQEKLKGAQVSTKRSGLGSERGTLRPGLPKEIGVPAYDDAAAVEKAQMFKMASDLQRFQTIKEPKALGQILADVATRPIDAIVKELKVDFDQLGGAADKTTSAIDKLRKGVGKTTRPKSDYVKDGKWGFYGSPTDDQISRNKAYDPINWGPEGELYKWRAEKRSTMFTPEARASRKQGAQQKLRRKNLGNLLGGKNAQNFLLGGGFPMLFGGGAGAVGGSLLGSGIAKSLNIPGGGFGLQIAGSAIGTMLEAAISKAQQLGNALKDLSMEGLIQSGIRVTGLMQTQIRMLEKMGEYGAAKEIAGAQVTAQTGGSAQNFEDMANIGNMLKGTWDDVVKSVGLTLGIISTPFLLALQGILWVVNEIFKKFNKLFKWLSDAGQWAFKNLLPKSMQESWIKTMDKMNTGLQAAIAKTQEWAIKTAKELSLLKTINKLESMRSDGKTAADKYSDFTMIDKIIKTNEFVKGQEKRREQAMIDNKKLWSADKEAHKAGLALIEEKEKAEREAFDREIKRQEKKLKLAADLYQYKLDNSTRRTTAGGANDVDRFELTTGTGFFSLGNQQKLKDIELNEKIIIQKEKIKLVETEFGAKSQEVHLEKLKLLRQQAELERLLTDEQVRARQLYVEMGAAIKNGIVSSLEAAINKTKTLGEVLADVLRSMGRMLMQYGVNAGMNALFPNFGGLSGGTKSSNQLANTPRWTPPANMFNPIPGGGMEFPTDSVMPENWPSYNPNTWNMAERASGGPVTGGRPYLVGEEGPEVFVPGASGGIVSNGALGGGMNINVNVDATGSSVEGDADESRQLGNLVGAAIQAELVRQKRPGGLLH